PTLERFTSNIDSAGLSDRVRLLRQSSVEVNWHEPIGLLFIDGLHDYENVGQDFRHFAPWIVPGGFIAFHDYTVFGDVARLVDEVLAESIYHDEDRAGTMLVLRRSQIGED